MYYGFIYEWTNMLNGKKYLRIAVKAERANVPVVRMGGQERLLPSPEHLTR